MNWSLFLTLLAQLAIVLVCAFVASAMIRAVILGIRENNDNNTKRR